MDIKKVFNTIALVFFFVFSLDTFANETLGLSNLVINKESLLKTLETLKASGNISETDYKKAYEEISKLNDTDVTEVINKAKETIQNDPKKVEEIKKKLNL